MLLHKGVITTRNADSKDHWEFSGVGGERIRRHKA